MGIDEGLIMSTNKIDVVQYHHITYTMQEMHAEPVIGKVNKEF